VDEFELRNADYSLSSDQEAVRDAFAEFSRNECPSERCAPPSRWATTRSCAGR
jgi:hypothetical protein